MCRRTLAFVGYDFTAAAFKIDIRLTNDASGSALVALTTQTTDVQGVRLSYAGTDTIANHLAAARLSQNNVDALLTATNPVTDALFQLSDSILLSIVAIRIDKATMIDPTKIPLPAQRGDVWVGAWDIHITPSGGDEDKYAGGDFIVEGGSTQ